MRRFKFRLHRVQALRRQEADAARLVLAQSVAVLVRCEQRVAVIDGLAEECQRTESNVAMLPLASGLLRGLEAARARAVRARAVADAQVTTTRTIYVQRRAAAAALSKLHETKRTAWLSALAAAERDELEESARLVRQVTTRRGRADGRTTGDVR